MDRVAGYLVLSILLNVITLRWAFREYLHRRHWQEEATALQHALRSFNQDDREPYSASAVLAWLVTGLFFVGLAALIYSLWG
jgi:uncharacterized membrane protein